MIKSISVPKREQMKGEPCGVPTEDRYEWVDNDITLESKHSSIVKDLRMGDEILVTMKVTGLREKTKEDGSEERSVTLEVPIGSDVVEQYKEPVGDARRELMP